MIKAIGVKHPSNRSSRGVGAMRPLARVIAAVLAMGAAAHARAGNPVLSQAWLAQQAGQRGTQSAVAPPSAMPGNLAAQTPGQLLQQHVLQQSLANLNRAAQTVAAQISAQQAAQHAAQQLSSPVPDGLSKGGLAVAAASNPSLWQNANAPTQSSTSGHVTVEVKQTAQKAILTWDSFNVGRNTTLYFNQSGGNQTNGKNNNWIALNRIVDPSGNPSQIFGQIKAEGTVYLLNRNGILFGGGSQVNTQSLIASSLDLFSSDVSTSNKQFLNGGIAAGPVDSPFLVNGLFTDGKNHDVVVQNGASITGGTQGFVLLAAPNVSNAGSIVDDQGQVILAAAAQLDNHTSSAALPLSVVNALDTEPGANPTYAGGTASNTGVLQSRRGEVEMDGYNVTQNGVALASTSISYPGSIALNAQDQYDSVYKRSGTLTLGPNSVTAVLPEEDGATTTSTAAATAAFTRSSLTLSGNVIDFQSGSLLEAPNAILTINARNDAPGGYTDPLAGRVYIDQGAVIDVSGLANVELPISALLVTIPLVGQNELSNSPLLRNSFLYHAQGVTVDSSQSGVTANGLAWVGSPVLNVAGYVDDIPRNVDQLMTNAGTINLTGNQVIVRSGASVKLDGGYVAYQAGWITTPNLIASNGAIYNITDADPNQTYLGFAGQYNVIDNRWGVSTNFSNPLLAGATRYDSGFAQGGNAGTLNVTTNEALALDGQISAQAFAGRNQVVQGSQPSGGTLDISVLNGIDIAGKNVGLNILVQQSVAPIEQTDSGFQLDTPWSTLLGDDDPTGTDPYDLSRWLPVSADLVQQGCFSKLGLSSTIDLNSNSVGGAPAYTGGEILQKAGSVLSVQPGGSVQFTANAINIQGEISAPAGAITLTGLGEGSFFDPTSFTNAVVPGDITIGGAAVLSTKGLWVNDSGVTADHYIGDRYINGGSISLVQDQSLLNGFSNTNDQTGSILLQSGSLLDASSGGYVNGSGQLQLTHGVPDGSGGNISLIDYADQGANKFNAQSNTLPASLGPGKLMLDGSLRAYGFSGGGTLSLQAIDVQIGGSVSDLALSNGLYLAPAFFAGQGFDNYAIASFTDANIAPGAMVQISRDNLLPNVDALLAAPTGTDLYGKGFSTDGGYVSVGQLAPYLRYVSRDTNGPGFSLNAGLYRNGYLTIGGTRVPVTYPGVSGALTMGKGAVISADAGAGITLTGAESTAVDGTIDAPGGKINITAIGGYSPVIPQVWLGPDAVLNASGVSLIDPLAAAVPGNNLGIAASTRYVPRTGLVLDGGSVSLTSPMGYVVTQQGSVIDVSGSSDVYDMPVANRTLGGSQTGYTPTPVWSDAGSILLAGAGLYADGGLLAQPGSSEAEGGSLQIVGTRGGEGFVFQMPVASAIVLQQSGLLVPGSGLQSGSGTEASGDAGALHFALDRLDGSGISSLTLGPDISVAAAINNSNSYVPVPIGFAGDVDLSLGKSFAAYAPTFTALPAGSKDLSGVSSTAYNAGNGTVQISAPYVELTGLLGSTQTQNSPVAGDGNLTFHADFIDLGGQINLQGWANSNLTPSNAVRFYVPVDFQYINANVFPGFLFSTGNITLQAAELYPVSNYAFAIDANPSGLTDAQGQPLSTTLTVLGNGVASAPLSAGGSLLLDADNIVQDGTVWVPSGNLIIGVQNPSATQASFGLITDGETLVATQNVTLGAGSLSSVSLGGETVPYGSTTDGLQWNYAGSPTVAVSPLAAPPSKSISIAGNHVSLNDGATIDIRGGGSLQASEWVPGTGGSVNVLTQYEISYANSTSGVEVPQYTDARAIYAIVPGYNAPVGAQDAAMTNAPGAGAGPAVGQSVYLSGVAGLAAGYYTLLPAGYATLPGAYRVVQNTSAQNSVLGQNGVLPDGTLSVTGYFANSLDGSHESTNTTFLVQSAPVWQQYSQYTFTTDDKYFAAQASKAGSVAPQVSADGGHLVLSATQQLQLGATLDNAPATGGRAGMVDIAAQAIQVVGADSTPLTNYLQISADQLSGLGAGSLLLGGTRQLTSNGYQVTSIADSVVLSNSSADPLQGSEILLVADGNGDAGAQGIMLQPGSYLAATGIAAPNATPLLFGNNANTSAGTAAVSGDGALLRVSQDGAVAVTRYDTSATSPSSLAIDAGATVQGGSSLTIDNSGATTVDPAAVFTAKNIQATANQISFVGSGAPAVTGGLVIGPNTLSLFDDASQVTLSSRGDIDFLGNVDINLPQALYLNANTFVSDGGTVSITSGTLGLGNAIGAGGSQTATGSGQLTLNAKQLDFTAGNGVMQGFAIVTANAGQGITGQGRGGMDFGAANVSFNTPILLAESGTDTALSTTGGFAVNSAAGTALADNNMGGGLSLIGGTLSVDTRVDALAGRLNLAASSGDLSLDSNANLDAAGVNKTFYDVTTYAAGGYLSLSADKGSVLVNTGAVLNFSGAPLGGTAGSLSIAAGNLVALNGSFKGGAVTGYKGGYFSLSSGGALDLDQLAQLTHDAGTTGGISITSGAGNLLLSAGNNLTAQDVYLTANGGSGAVNANTGVVDIEGTVNVSGNAAGQIQLYGRNGVTVNGSLLAVSSVPGQFGGIVDIGTLGTPDSGANNLNSTYGYENVQPGNAGSIVFGPHAIVNVAGGSAGVGGIVSLRAPLLVNGDVPITFANSATIEGANKVSMVPYAVWSTDDTEYQNTAKYFDGLIDPAGWYANAGAGSTPQMVAGTWYDATAAVLPTPTTAAMLQTYLSNDYFVPDAVNAAHQDFYGYVGGNAGQPGTLMGFVEQPGYTFGNRYAGIANLQISPGVELINPDAGINGGNISVLTNWNLGAGVTAADGTIQLAYRYAANPTISASGTAPTLSLLALHNLNVDASITDGFYQQNVGAEIAAPVFAPSGAQDPLYATDYNLYLQAINFLQTGNSEYLGGYLSPSQGPYDLWNGGYTFFYDPTDSFINPLGASSITDSTNSQFYQPVVAPLTAQGTAYYQNYGAYINDVGAGQPGTWSYAFNNADYNGLLAYNPSTVAAPQIAAYANYAAYAQAYQTWLTDNFQSSVPLPQMQTPQPLLSPLQSEANGDYAQYSSDYANYIAGFNTYYNYVATNLGNGTSSVLFYAPFTPYAASTQVPQAANNSPSNMPSLGNPVSLASATLLGGSSSSYQLVAGANFASANPLAVAANTGAGNINLNGDFAVQYAASGGNGATLEFPTVVRTGTGSIDIVAAGDIDWLDKKAPAAIYTAGAPATDTTAGTGVTAVVPSGDGAVPDWLVNDAVHPDNAGNILLQAGGDIHGIEQVYDTTGNMTGTAGTFIGQFWWPWMETGNSATGSSINFSNFDQGVMSVGGNVAVTAGGNISDLSVSLPTTWYANAAGTAITTVGGGNLSVIAGGDILSGSYFVANGTGSLAAGGLIGSDFSYVLPNGSTGPNGSALGGVVTPVSTLLALQNAQWNVQARDGVDIADILNPSYASPDALNADEQSYSANSAVKASTASGDLTLGSLAWEIRVLGDSAADTDLGVLPSTLDFTALSGNINVLTAGGLYPSATGNLSLLAGDSIQFSQQNYDIESSTQGSSQSFGLIDADASLLPSPLQPQGSNVANYTHLSAQNYLDQGANNPYTNYLHQAGLHDADTNPVRIYALTGSIVDGTTAPNGIQMDQVLIEPDKPALIYAGQDIVDLSFLGQQTHQSDITRIAAGGSIYDSQYIGTNLFSSLAPVGLNYQLVPVIEMSGVGTLDVEAGRNMGPFTSQTDLLNAGSTQADVPTGIESVGNAYNPYLPHDGANIDVLFGVRPGIETSNFLTQYLSNPAVSGSFGSLLPDLVTFMQQHEDGYAVNTGFAQDQPNIVLSTQQAEAAFQLLPTYVQQQFVQQEFFKLLAQVGTDYNDPSSPYYHQYARGYAAIQSLFPASLGYTNNGAGAGGLNGEAQEMPTGDLDIRSSTIQTQQGGDINILGPGGQALIGSVDAPPVITNAGGLVLAGPNDIGVLTLEQGNVNIFTDSSLLLAQSRVFTEQGGNMVIWSSNGDINAGQGAKTVAVVPPPTYLCDLDAYCLIDARGEVSGAGIATLQTIADAAPGNVYLVAPRGTVDAGDAGIRVSGNVVLAAAQVLNAVNIQVQGNKIGVPIAQSVNIGALNAASAAAGAVTKVAQDLMNQQKNDALSKLPSIISVQMLGFGGNDSSSIMGNGSGYDPSSPVQVLGAGHLSELSKQALTKSERRRLVE